MPGRLATAGRKPTMMDGNGRGPGHIGDDANNLSQFVPERLRIRDDWASPGRDRQSDHIDPYSLSGL
jgi:hypothetical protein